MNETIKAALTQAYNLSQAKLYAGDVGHLQYWINRLNQHFYRDIDTGKPVERNPAELIALIHSELSEMLEGVRKDVKDTHLKHRRMEEVEAADVLIRLLDYCAYRHLDLEGAVKEKLTYNTTRHDHTNEARRAVNGKKF